MLHGCRSWVGSDMLGRALSPCREGTSSSWAWAGAHVGLLSIPYKPTLLGYPKKSSTGWSLGTCGGFCFLWHIRHEELVEQRSSWKSEMSTCKVWQEQNLVFSIYFINEGLQPVQANSWSLRTLMPASSQAQSHECRRSLLLAETESLTTFLPLSGFLSNFSPHSNLAKVLSTLFPRIPRETKRFTTAHLPKDWSGFPVESNTVFLISSRPVKSSMTEALHIWVATK